MIKLLILILSLIVSANLLTAAPTWTRDFQIDAGQFKVVNFETFLSNKTTAIIKPTKTGTGSLNYNYTNFTSTPRLSFGIKSYGLIPISNSSFPYLSMGYRLSIPSKNKTGFSYSILVFGVQMVSLHYQYFAVVGYTNLYYMQFYTITFDTTSNVRNTSSSSTRVTTLTYNNPQNFTTDSNFTSSQMIIQAWPYSYLYTPTGSVISLELSTTLASRSTFNLDITVDYGFSLEQLCISVLLFNKTQIYQYSYSIFIDYTTYNITGSNTSNAILNSTINNITQQYQFRNSQQGVYSVYLPFSAVGSPTVWYFSATSNDTSKLSYRSIQQRVRVCSGLTPYYLVDDQLCYDSCPLIYYAYNSSYGYCKRCHYSCLQCSSADISTACTQCNATALRVLTNNSCPCNLTYFDNGTQLCVACYYTCRTCSSTSSNSCITCDSALHRTINNSTCSCSLGYYENNTCFNCLNNCLECSYQTSNQSFTCVSCNASLYLELNITQQSCVCKNGYFNSSGSCSPCMSGCLSCLDSLTCNICDSTNHWIKNISNSKCICSDTYYLNSTNICLPCDISCLTCISGSNSSCMSCDSNLNRQLANSTCICKIGFYQNITCLPCLNNCLSCQYITGNQTYLCLSCDIAIFLTKINNTCQCKDGYFNNSGGCAICMDGCLICSNGTQCISCDVVNGWELNSTNQCQCKNGLFQTIFNTTSICAACNSTCLTCNAASNNSCLTCDSNLSRTLSNSSCQCNPGFYENITCFTCTGGCTLCSYSLGNYICLACDSGFLQVIDASQSFCVCQAAYYNNSGTCSPCSVGCKDCSSNFNCSTCDTILNFELQNNTCACTISHYENNQTCLPCQSGCLICSFNNTILQCSQCNTSGHFQLSNNNCVCSAGFVQNSSICISSNSSTCGNGVIELIEGCDDNNTVNFDGCSDSCQVEADHYCLNNITNISICYYSKQISLITQDIFKKPLQNRVIVTLLISAPNCNTNFLKSYLQNGLAVNLQNIQARLLAAASTDIVSKTIIYNSIDSTATVDFQYNQDIDLTKKQLIFSSSQTYLEPTSKYFYDSPKVSITLSNPNNLLLTTYATSSQIDTFRAISLSFAALIAMMWLFWLISLCYNQTATAVEFMIVAQIAYESLLQRKFITDGWIGLVLYGKYCYGYNINYSTQIIYDRLQILSLNTYLFHTLNITTILLVLAVTFIIVFFCYETIKMKREQNLVELNSTQSKIDTRSKRAIEAAQEQQEKSLKIKKGIILVFFEAGTSLSLLTIKIVMINIMLISLKVLPDVVIVSSILAISYFLMWYFYYRCFDMELLDDFSFKRMLRDAEDSSKIKSFSSKVGNFFVKYYYLSLFIMLALFGIVAGSPSLGASFYIAIIVVTTFYLILMIAYGVYFRIMHLVRSACNLFGLVGIMVLHMLESMNVERPGQTTTGPIICLGFLFFSFTLNFGIMGYIQYRRNRNRKPKYRNGKVAPAELLRTEDPIIFNQPINPNLIRQIQQQNLDEIRKSNNSNGSLAQQSKFESLKSKSKERSVSSTHKKQPIPRHQQHQYEQTAEKKDIGNSNIDSILRNAKQYIVVRQKVQDLSNKQQFDEVSQAERVEIIDMSRSFSDFSKTKTKIKNEAKQIKIVNDDTTNKKNIQFIENQA